MAGHLATFGVPHRPNCKVKPIIPVSEDDISTEVSSSASVQESAHTSPSPTVVTASSSLSSTAPVSGNDTQTMTSTATAAPSTSQPQPGTSKDSDSDSVVLTSKGVEANLVQQVDMLKAKILEEEKALEAERTEAIWSLQAQAKDLTDRLEAIRV